MNPLDTVIIKAQVLSDYERLMWELIELIQYFCPRCGKTFSSTELQENRYCGKCGRFFTKSDRILMEKNKKADSKSAQMTVPTNDLVKKLLDFGKEVTAEELVPVLVQEAAKEIADPFAFALAGVLDRGTKAEIIWTIPYHLKNQLGTLDPHFFANASLEEIDSIFRKLPTKPRYLGDASRSVKELSQIVVNNYEGKTQKIWENKSSQQIKATFERIYGVGPGIASMITLLLERWFGVHFDDLDHRKIDVKPDVHIIRVFMRMGFISEPTSDAALYAARSLNPEFPGALDAPTWYIGRNWCTAYSFNCNQCPVTEACPKIH